MKNHEATCELNALDLIEKSVPRQLVSWSYGGDWVNIWVQRLAQRMPYASLGIGACLSYRGLHTYTMLFLWSAAAAQVVDSAV